MLDPESPTVPTSNLWLARRVRQYTRTASQTFEFTRLHTVQDVVPCFTVQYYTRVLYIAHSVTFPATATATGIGT